MEFNENFNPRAPCGARPLRKAIIASKSEISTHAPLAGRDNFPRQNRGTIVISTHAPLAGRDPGLSSRRNKYFVFQPTRPLRGATEVNRCLRYEEYLFQPTRPLRGATPLCRVLSVVLERFQPTRPLRGATGKAASSAAPSPISTHAPLAGRDHISLVVHWVLHGISTHAPLAGRDVNGHKYLKHHYRFQPTRPLRGATIFGELSYRAPLISTHAPLAGRDGRRKVRRALCQGFQPTRPLRGATDAVREIDRAQSNFNPRAPCGARLSGDLR